MNDKEATKVEAGKDDVSLEIGEGYVTIGLKLDMGERLIPHVVELTPDKADQLGKKLQHYAEIARSISTSA